MDTKQLHITTKYWLVCGGRSQFIKTGNPSINLSNALSKIESLCAGDLLPLHATGFPENWCHSFL